jgi:hypothetical protein
MAALLLIGAWLWLKVDATEQLAPETQGATTAVGLV